MGNFIALGASETVALTAVTAASTAAPRGGDYRVISNQQFHIAVDEAATATHAFVAAGEEFYVSVPADGTINVIRNSVDGTVWVTRVERA